MALLPIALTAPFSMMRKFFDAARQVGENRFPAASRIPRQYRTDAGIFVTPDLALRNPVVWACTRYLSQALALLPVLILAPDNISLEVNPVAHAVKDLLGNRPCAEYSAFAFRETLMRWALLWGNGYAEIQRDNAGRVCALWPIHPDRVIPYRHDDGSLYFRVYNGAMYTPTDLQAGYVDMEPEDIFHLKGFGDGPIGVNVVDYAAQTIGWAMAAELFGASFFGDGMAIGGVVQLKGRADNGMIARMRDEFEARFARRRGGRPNRWAFVDNDATVTKMNATPNEGQFIDTLNFQVDSICRWFGVPPSKVQHLIRGTFGNVESAAIEVVVDSIMPWTKRFEEECNFKLFGQNRQGLMVNLDLKGLLRGDFLTRQQGFEVMRRNGVITADQWAEGEGFKKPGPKQGGDVNMLINVWSRQKDVADGVGAATPPKPGEPQTEEPATEPKKPGAPAAPPPPAKASPKALALLEFAEVIAEEPIHAA